DGVHHAGRVEIARNAVGAGLGAALLGVFIAYAFGARSGGHGARRASTPAYTLEAGLVLRAEEPVIAERTGLLVHRHAHMSVFIPDRLEALGYDHRRTVLLARGWHLGAACATGAASAAGRGVAAAPC